MVLKHARDVGMELAALLVPQKLAAAFGAKYEMDDDVGKGLGHNYGAFTGLGKIVDADNPALQAGL